MTTPTHCTCEKSAIREWTIAGGGKAFYRQCLGCGRRLGNAIKRDLLPHYPVPPADLELQQIYQHKWDEWRSDLMQKDRQARDAWWEKYTAYLNTEEWQRKRDLVLDRDGHLCQGCLKKRATVVHHLTYAHAFNELLFELMSLCRDCHDACHDEAAVPYDRVSF